MAEVLGLGLEVVRVVVLGEVVALEEEGAPVVVSAMEVALVVGKVAALEEEEAPVEVLVEGSDMAVALEVGLVEEKVEA
ncbi:hypothetical protein E2562_018416 [Oryza meyeriana var. granulata]|uniref:Uncharacterized protein n=1 Tax=Oryza meyeriana var. granulata TaxID=110450 RepID=A0A6G1D411_9ORYZ|nr:hypothetical protein E2562_018416 [Oryza meyeriana var. granulata]